MRWSSWDFRSACCPPSSSMTTRCARQAKSAKYGPIGCWRRNLCPCSRPARNRCQSRSSASVEDFRSFRAKVTPLTPTLSPRCGEREYEMQCGKSRSIQWPNPCRDRAPLLLAPPIRLPLAKSRGEGCVDAQRTRSAIRALRNSPSPRIAGRGLGSGAPQASSAIRALRILPLPASRGEGRGQRRRKPAQPSALCAILPLPASRGEGWGEGRRKPARPSALRAILPLPASRGEGWGQGRRKPAQPFACIRSSYERRRAAGSNVQVLTTISPSSSRCASERSIAITCAPVPTNALRRSSPMRACSAAV